MVCVGGGGGGAKMPMRVREGDYVVLVPESGGGYPSVVQVSRNGYVFYSVARANGV